MTIFTTDGSLVQREISPGGGTYATIPQVMTAKLPPHERKTQDVYIHDQSAPVTKTGGTEPMEATFDVAWDPANSYHQNLWADFTAKTSRNYRMILPDTGAAQFDFAAIVSKLEADDLDAEGNPLKLSVTLKLAAAPTITW